MQRSDERALRDMGREAMYSASRAASGSAPVGIIRSVMTVKRVNGDGTLDLDMGSAARSLPLAGIRMTTCCSGVKAGDRVLVDTFGHRTYVVGVLA